MKLSVWSSYYIDLSPEDMVLEFEKHAFNYCELSDEHAVVLMKRGNPTETGAKFKEFADSHGVFFPQGHLRLGAKICEPGHVDALKKELELFCAIGVKNAVLHVDSMERYPDTPLEEIKSKNVEALKVLTEHIKGTDMVICLENLRDKSVTKSADELLWFINEIDSPNLGICLDTGHLNLCDKNQTAFIQKAGKHLKALHIQDNDGSGDQHIMPFGKGSVDVREVVLQTKKLGYDGLYNLEIPGENRCSLEIRGFKLEYLKRVFELIDEQTNG